MKYYIVLSFSWRVLCLYFLRNYRTVILNMHICINLSKNVWTLCLSGRLYTVDKPYSEWFLFSQTRQTSDWTLSNINAIGTRWLTDRVLADLGHLIPILAGSYDQIINLRWRHLIALYGFCSSKCVLELNHVTGRERLWIYKGRSH